MIAVTGATGAIGGRVARALARQGLEQRLLVRRPEAAPEFGEVVHFDYAAPDPAALDGVETLLMVSGAETADRVDQHRAVIDAAVRAGVGHVVYTSFAGAAPDCTFTLGRDHFATEQAIRESGLGFTFLRDNFYSDVFPFFVGDDGVIRGPAGEGRVAVVTRDDVAAGAVVVLLAPEAHAGRTWDLTGPSALTLDEIAALLSGSPVMGGRAVSFHDETLEEAYESRKKWPAPPWQYDAWVSTYTAIGAGELAEVTDHVEQLTGRPATSFADFVQSSPGT